MPDNPARPIRPTFAADLPVSLLVGLVRAEPVAVAPAREALTAEIVEACGRLTAQHAGKPPADIAGLAPARELYRAFGIDPTRTRPSSEALLRRALQGKPMPKILNAVDVCTLCSTSTSRGGRSSPTRRDPSGTRPRTRCGPP